MLYLLAYVLFPLLLGFSLCAWGYYMLKRRQADLNMKQQLRLQQELDSWQINKDVSRSFRQGAKGVLDGAAAADR